MKIQNKNISTFNNFYLVEPNKSVNTHSTCLSLSTKAIAVHPARAGSQPFQASARSFQSSLQMLFACLKITLE